MHSNLASLVRRAAVCFLLGLLSFCAAAPVLAGAPEGLQEKTDAARVAKKVRKALANAHDAEEEREALSSFRHEVAEYAVLHARQRAKLAARKESVAAQRDLAQAIEAKRDKASSGDVFAPEIQPLFLRLIAEQLEGPDTLDARKAVLQGNPEHDEDSVHVVVRVNARYPRGASLSTVPPSLLATLPRLPAPLEYRFVGRDLILLDSVAGLIVDFLSNAAPDLTIKKLP